jgi:hypothetical protein
MAVINASPGTELSATVTSITLDASGSTVQGTASYLWSDNSTSPTLVVTTPGTYSVTVTDDANECTDTESIIITENFTSYNTIASGDWDDPTIWDTGTVPPEPIPAGVTVNINHGVFILTGLTITNAGTINRPQSGSGLVFLRGGSLINTAGGVIDFATGSVLLLDDNNSYFENQSGAEFQLRANATFVVQTSIDPATVSVVNAGTFSREGNLVLGATLQNQTGGQFTGSGSVIINTSGTLENAGTLGVTSPGILYKYYRGKNHRLGNADQRRQF